MSKERAIALLGTAKLMESPEDIKQFITRALRHLETDGDPIPTMELAGDMIHSGLVTLHENIPSWADTPKEKAKKFAICESALGQIKEYATMGLKARTQGSLNTVQDLLKGQANHNLQEFAGEDCKVTITGPDGHSVDTTLAELGRAAELARDPDVVEKILGGE